MEKDLRPKEDLRDLAELHLSLGEGDQITNQSLFNELREQGYQIEHMDSEIQNYFTEQKTGLKQTYELRKDEELYELHIEKEEGVMKNYWFEE